MTNTRGIQFLLPWQNFVIFCCDNKINLVSQQKLNLNLSGDENLRCKSKVMKTSNFLERNRRQKFLSKIKLKLFSSQKLVEYSTVTIDNFHFFWIRNEN